MLPGKAKGEFMPRNIVNSTTIYGVAFVLLLSIVWIQFVLKENAIQNHLHMLNHVKTNDIYKKCRWVFATGDLELIMHTLAHASYKEHVACLKEYMEDTSLTDSQFKTVVLFKAAGLHKKNGKKIRFFDLLPEKVRKEQLLLKMAAIHCPEIIPPLYGWLKMQPEDYVQRQVSEVYAYAIKDNNPLLFDCLLEYDIPLNPHQATEYLHVVLNEDKHQAFVCLLMKAGAKMSPQSIMNKFVSNQLIALQESKNVFYKQLFTLIHT